MRQISRAIDYTTAQTGHPLASVLAVLVSLADLVWGYLLGWSNAYFAANGMATGLVSIVLLFFLQHGQNRGNAAIQLKLDSLALAQPDVSNKVAGAETLPEVEIQRMHNEALSQIEDAVEDVVNGEDEKREG